ncbi:hypothetical protein HWV62_20790, partial [Athelia sp. TMB]
MQGGDTSYWKNLPIRIIKYVVDKKLKVWPVISYDSTVAFSELQSLLVADEFDSSNTLAALAAAGIQITQPPTYIQALLKKTDIKFTPLTPETARDSLLVRCLYTDLRHSLILYPQLNLAVLSRMQSDASAIKCIASYLLSAGNIGLLIGLPLVRLASGELTSLERHGQTTQIHTLLDHGSLNVFRYHDQDAIDLTQLSPHDAALFLTAGPTTVNVAPLDVMQIALYLKSAFADFGLDVDVSATDAVSDDLIKWLISFWEWVSSWPMRLQLYQSIGPLPLLPTRRDTLVPVLQGIMEDAPVNMLVLEALESLKISFIHPGMSQPARRPLVEQALIKSANNGIHLLQQLPPSHAYNIRSETVEPLRTHLLASLAAFVRSDPLTGEQSRKLRALPMFPILLARLDTPIADTVIRAIDDVAKVISVDQTSLLPVLPETAYIKGCDVLADALSGVFERKSTAKMVSLAVEHIVRQP